ncbi:hypothetical protein N7489_010471 [Penicillium chrysogenum]|uniref:Rhodopsin domain-containing protein n=1 Tax=Penicillium chrysogenum TaxID=5076 RepID=A0ABQ8WUF5_PENCH|nr:uncharacterized protein N7489_010471 [Penicillium chrysogenum]KAJ5229763.1 hypothetical protein N7489_010471 [Penicillium chrysogenum]KAJ5259167.1 hypothetical protein N7524_010723 [Penicillium chrysogenum]KAJ5282351.1 hypothetical protein N7505_000331 [Penicillium chrysogenum]KAJ6169643.1 hypothetical protein N7497_002486 [Penicillium chrysogenum]
MGWVYNLHETDPNSDIPRVIGVCLVCSILAFLAVCLRFYVRISSKRSPWIDDYSALVASVLTLAYAGIAVAQTRWGQGLSAAYFPKENVIPFSKIQYAGGPVYCLAVLGFKVALLTSYLRIAGIIERYRKIIFAAIVVCVINQLIFTFIISISCTPVAKQWDSSLEGHCIHTIPFYFALGGTSIALDLIIIALPLPVLWKLQLRLKQKVLLAGLFALGFFVTVIQVIRIFTVKALETYTDSKNIVIWSCVETSLGVVIACIPTYGPLFKSFASTVTSYRNRDTSRTYALSSVRQGTGTGSAIARKKSNFEPIYESEGPPVTDIRSGAPTNDGDSEEHILSEAENMKVYVTSEFTVKSGVAH